MVNRWHRNELLIAFKLYCELPFGKLHSKNPVIVHYAHLLGRTPSSLAMKLVNIASLDPVIVNSGRKGLSGASQADRAMWVEMTQDWVGFVASIALAEKAVGANPLTEEAQPIQATPETLSYEGLTKEATVNIRVGQSFFRQCILSAYDFRCCMSGLSLPSLLVASHIVPWRSDTQNRLNPRNGLCLSVLHDKAFDQGFITLSENHQIMISPALKAKALDPFAKATLCQYEGKTIAIPQKFQPDPVFLDYHRQHVFKVA
jgi:putative restriction endonuclease